MRKTLFLSTVSASALVASPSFAAFDPADPVGSILGDIPMDTILSGIGAFAAAAVMVFVAIACLPLARKLLGSVLR